MIGGACFRTGYFVNIEATGREKLALSTLLTVLDDQDSVTIVSTVWGRVKG